MNGNLPQSSGIKRNKKACTECRQQKVRCDATEDSTDPCTRCRKMNLSCVISDPFKREHKRQRLSELEHEAYELRRKLEGKNPWQGPLTTPSVSTESSIRLTPMNKHQTASPPIGLAGVSPVIGLPGVSPPTVLPGVSALVTETSNDESTPVDPHEPTVAQTIEGVTVPAHVIDELFQRFFMEFAKFLPILDRDLPPNEFYRRSKFLFWTVIAVASRNFTKDPTLLDSIGDKVLSLALLSLRHTTIPVIQGCLLLLTWPLPRSAVGYADVTFAISGSLIHMAMSIGLHIPTSSQDFSRVKVTLSEAEIVRRAELWGHCIVTYQRSCSFKGHCPLSLLDLYQDAEQRHALFSRISPSLRFQLKLNSLLTRCYSAMLQHGLRLMTREQEHTLDLMIRVFEATIRDVEPECNTELDKFHLYVSRLTVQAFHFYKLTSSPHPTYLLTRLYATACQVLQYIDKLDQNVIKLSAAPQYFVSSNNLATVTLLRLIKSSTAQYLDLDTAKETLFLGVSILKRLSMENNDIPARMIRVATQLYNSDKVFRRPDGTEHTALRIRTRLAMSPVFDTLWWWREEFGGQSGAYSMQSQLPETKVGGGAGGLDPANQTSETSPQVNLQAYSNTTPTGPYQELNFLDDQLLAELGWTNNSNYLYSAMPGPMVTDWYSPSNVNGFAL